VSVINKHASHNKVANACAVPDFRSSNGLFATLRSENKLKASGKHLFDASVYQTDDSTSAFHDMVRDMSTMTKDAKPTAFHEMLATLASEGRLMRLYTQNVDGLDTSLPPLATKVPLASRGPWPQTIQLHGSLENMVCTKCNILKTFDATLFNGPSPPSCEVCKAHDEVRTEQAGKRSHGIGKLRPRMVLYNEHNPDEDAIGAASQADLRARPDAVIVVGTSLEIPGVKRMVREMCKVVRGRKYGDAIWINRSPPPIAKEYEDCWDLIVAGDCDAVAQCANMRRWNDEGNDYKDCTESEAELAKKNDGDIKVLVKPQKKKSPTPRSSVTPKKSGTPALMTPADSPKVKTAKLPKVFQFPQFNLTDGKKSLLPKGNSKNGVTKKTIPKASSKSQLNKVAASRKPTGNPSIKDTFKVAKVQIPPSTPTKKQSATPPAIVKNRPSPTNMERAKRLLASVEEEEKQQSVPMGPISPNSLKNNGPLNPTKADSIGAKLEKVEIPLKVEIPDPDRLKRMSEEVVSPSTTPKGMNGLLCN
jgi:NAD-dependent histone deacetylase SIR2